MSQTNFSSSRAIELWSEQTCQALLGLVLRAGALSPGQPPPHDWMEKLRAAAHHEADLTARLLPLLTGSLGALPTVQGLLVWLIDNSSSFVTGFVTGLNQADTANSSCVGTDCVDGNIRWQLLAACHLVHRLQTLELRFAGELARQKQEAIYHFAYGLSHELNNPLANISTRAGVLASEETQPRRRNMLETIISSAMRGSEMLGDLMLVARPPQLQRVSTRIDRLLQELVQRSQVWGQPLAVEVRGELNSQACLEIDAVAFTEALWALVRNAIEAIPDGGQVSIRSRDEVDVPEGSVVRIEVIDTGTGLSTQSRAHCFDPYYSGREAGRGLGLGLCKAKRIVELHGGELLLDNRPCGGCAASIVLPFISSTTVAQASSL